MKQVVVYITEIYIYVYSCLFIYRYNVTNTSFQCITSVTWRKHYDNDVCEFTCCPVHIFTAIQWLPTWYIQMYPVQWGCWLLAPLEWVAGLGMGTSTARGARFPVPNRSYPAVREPARSSPIHPIARLSGSERLRRSTAKILLALLYIFLTENIWILNISLKHVPYGLIENMSALVQIMAWCRQETIHCLIQWWFSSLMHISMG